MFNDFKTIIIGGGFSGLTLALSLLQKGYKVEVYEKRSDLNEVGAGVQIAPNGVRVIKHLGLFDQVVKHACQSRYRRIGLWDSLNSEIFHDLDDNWLNKYGNYWSLSRNDLYQALLKAVLSLDAECIKIDHKLIDYTQMGNHVTAYFANGNIANGNVLIGADGIFSKVRQKTFGDINPEFAGMIAWRGIGLRTSLKSEHQTTDTVIYNSKNQLVITYPICGSKYFYFFGTATRDSYDESKSFEMGTSKDCEDDFVGWNDRIKNMISNFDKIWKWPLYYQPPAAKWFDSNMALIGDACHAVMPFNGQGLNMGLEDAMHLSCYLDHYELPSNALACYGVHRKERAMKIFHNSSWMYNKFLKKDFEPEKKIQNIIMNREKIIQENFDWIWKYDARDILV